MPSWTNQLLVAVTQGVVTGLVTAFFAWFYL